jgi:hypothetical protein
MALRTIADLPALDVEKVIREQRTENLAESLFEISYMEDFGQFDTYKSKYVKFKGLSSLIVDSMANNDFDFYGHKTFYGGVSISNGLDLTGDFLVNDGVDDWDRYRAVINAGDINFNSSSLQLCSETLNAYIDRGELRSYDGGTQILNWDNQSFNVNVKLYAEEISCSGLVVNNNAVFNGRATFKNVINGCALCAQWADLAELYKADADYPPGTLVRFGGDAEITVADGSANAVVTDRPGLVLNGCGGRDGVYKGIALVGRTPVRVYGRVRRFDRLAPDPDRPGLAKALADRSAPAVAVALGSSDAEGEALVECAVRLEL